jgi:acetyltransferase
MDITMPRDLRTMSLAADPCTAGSGHLRVPGAREDGAAAGGTNVARAALADGAPIVVRLDDGARVRLREARSDDGGALRRMFLRLSDRSRFLYFCAGVPANDIWADRFVALGRSDGRTTYALVAEPGDTHDGDHEIIGLACYVRKTSGPAADIGILLADAWQSRGLGRFVLDRLGLEARRRAVAVFTGTVLWENRRMLRLVRGLFPQAQLSCAQGMCDLTITFEGGAAPQVL